MCVSVCYAMGHAAWNKSYDDDDDSLVLNATKRSPKNNNDEKLSHVMLSESIIFRAPKDDWLWQHDLRQFIVNYFLFLQRVRIARNAERCTS